MIKGIHQYLSSAVRRDAIGEYAFVLRNAFREMGYDSEIFYDSCSEEIRDEVIPFKKYSQYSSSNNLFVIHYGIKLPYIKPLTSLLDKKILVYHNVTPAKFFEIFGRWGGDRYFILFKMLRVSSGPCCFLSLSCTVR